MVAALVSERAGSARRGVTELLRRVSLRPHVVDCFLELDDPYSYLLAHFLPALRESYNVTLRMRLAESLGDAFRPCPELQAEYAVHECAHLAREFGIPFLDKGNAPPVEHRRAMLAYLAGLHERDDFDDELLKSLAYYWRGDAENIARRAAGTADAAAAAGLLEQNRRLLAECGHYSCATLNYGGEWYQGVERLGHLTARLDELGARRADKADARLASIENVMALDLPVAPPGAARDLPPLELFFSFRSPYSYLAIQRSFEIADAFGLRLALRPVLPMLMRGMQVPRQKRNYIIRDAAREARRHGIPFGRFADPLGAGVERCHAVFAYAGQENRERDFVESATSAIWSEGVDVSGDAGMRSVADRAGLFWPDVLKAMKNDEWHQQAEVNRTDLGGSGCWGVPVVRLGDFAAWGQDRLWLLVRHIEDSCDTGEGILI